MREITWQMKWLLGFGQHCWTLWCYLAGIEETYAHYDLDFDREVHPQLYPKAPVQKLLGKVVSRERSDATEMNVFRGDVFPRRKCRVWMEGAEEILVWAEEHTQSVYTHKGPMPIKFYKTCIMIILLEIITTANGFERKPHPEGVDYLLAKYGLDKKSVYHIGDRTLMWMSPSIRRS